jgi:high-affinity iron transporter
MSVFLVLFPASVAFADQEAERLVALLDYLGSNYKNAVQDGKVVSQHEYQKMQEFAKRTLELINRLKEIDKGDRAGINSGINSLAHEIENKAEAKTVAELAASTKKKLISNYGIVTYPKRLPSLARGKTIYLENCAQCHGESGKGDGLSRSTMNPKNPAPTDFTDAEFMVGLSPFNAYNAISFGVENTAMPSFAALSEEQRWQVAFYVLSLRFSPESAKAGAILLQSKSIPEGLTNVATLATNSDEQLLEKLKAYSAKKSEDALLSASNPTLTPFSSPWTAVDFKEALAYLRRGLPETTDPLLIVQTLLRESSELYAKGEKEKAYQKAVEAYLVHLKMEVNLGEAAQMLASADTLWGYYAFLNSALIILREGLEVALILPTILTMLRVMGATQAIRYIHLGWILALIAGALTWIATQTLLTLSGQHRESIEGFITAFAAVVLFYVGYWLHTRAAAKKWQAFIREKVQDVVSTKRVFALVGISFFAVYRETFEVVLFYQALWLQNESNQGAVIWGFLAGLAALVLVIFAILKLGLHLPLKYFFGATGALLYIMAFTFAGNGIKELQAAGWLPSTALSFPPQVPLLGIYPTLETLAAQAVMLFAFIAITLWLATEHRRGRVSR